jgi:hypothetical protein
MSRSVRFGNTETNRVPSHYIHKDTGATWWCMCKKGGLWYRMFTDGSCGAAVKSHEYNPNTRPESFEPRYGDLVITIQEFSH